MSRSLAAAIICLVLSACAGGNGPEGGVATLDALQKFQADCAARGLTMQLKTDGDSQSIDAYECVRK